MRLQINPSGRHGTTCGTRNGQARLNLGSQDGCFPTTPQAFNKHSSRMRVVQEVPSTRHQQLPAPNPWQSLRLRHITNMKRSYKLSDVRVNLFLSVSLALFLPSIGGKCASRPGPRPPIPPCLVSLSLMHQGACTSSGQHRPSPGASYSSQPRMLSSITISE